MNTLLALALITACGETDEPTTTSPGYLGAFMCQSDSSVIIDAPPDAVLMVQACADTVKPAALSCAPTSWFVTETGTFAFCDHFGNGVDSAWVEVWALTPA